ncbi:hypothetical protein [Streptomyces sp. S584]|uniref:hypothetical protein n=1 Tax=Streptomyces sp. S584 TaxID=3096010 RepID=UPI002AFDEA7A|nr:hypothetical protein [Streptomyces sp. S584]
MSTRLAEERHTPGNHLVAHRMTLPCSAEGFGEAVNRVRRRAEAIRTSRMGDATRLALSALTPRLGEWATRWMSVAQAAPVVASSVTFPDAMTCAGGRLTAASMFCEPHDERLCYLSFTRTTDVIRCAVVYDDAPLLTRPTSPAIGRRHCTHARKRCFMPGPSFTRR